MAQTGEKRVRFEDQLVDVEIEPATPATKKPPPTIFPGKNVFLENYSNSPEWTRFENPVVYMEEEILPEEVEGDILPEQLHNEELSAMRSKGREPGVKHNEPRRHPLSQVTNARDTISPMPNYLQPKGIVLQGDGRHGAPIPISDDGEENENLSSDDSPNGGRDDDPIIINDDNVEEEEPIDDEGDLDELEPQDDTFEFLFRQGRKTG